MAQKKLRVVHYLNQFFGQIGGEEKQTRPHGTFFDHRLYGQRRSRGAWFGSTKRAG